MIGELIGDFKGKNIGWRVLPDGKIETTAQGTGKILGVGAFVLATSVGIMANGIFMGETNSVFTTMDGELSDVERYRGRISFWKWRIHKSCIYPHHAIKKT